METEVNVLCCDNCGALYEESTMQLIQGPELVVCTPCYRRHKPAIRESWKQEQCAATYLLSPLELRARVPECLNAPTVYVPPPTKKERSMSRFEMWKDYNEAQGIAGYSSGGRRR